MVENNSIIVDIHRTQIVEKWCRGVHNKYRRGSNSDIVDDLIQSTYEIILHYPHDKLVQIANNKKILTSFIYIIIKNQYLSMTSDFAKTNKNTRGILSIEEINTFNIHE